MKFPLKVYSRMMSVDPEPISKRTAKARDTKAAILASARQAFAKHGYEGAGLRGIAKGAGVTAMMVNRYFGTKEGLFAEVLADSMRDPVILSSENLAAANLPRVLAEALVGITAKGADPLDGFLILFRSTSSPTASRIARERIAAAHQVTAASAVVGDHAPERAALLLSLVAGVQMMRQMVRLDALAEVDPADLADILTPIIGEILRWRPASVA